MRTPDGADAPVREGFCGSSKSPGGAGIAAGHPPSRDQQGIPRRRAPEAAGWAKGESGEFSTTRKTDLAGESAASKVNTITINKFKSKFPSHLPGRRTRDIIVPCRYECKEKGCPF